jgi:hypothetical protein
MTEVAAGKRRNRRISYFGHLYSLLGGIFAYLRGEICDRNSSKLSRLARLRAMTAPQNGQSFSS